jgi:hypothetical protein
MDLDDITTAIAAGEFDGRLDQLVAAAVERVQVGAVSMPWRLRFDGDEWTQESVTVGELAFAEQHCWVDTPQGRRHATRAEIDPRIRTDHLLALVVAHLHKAQSVPLRDATKRAEAITAADLDGIVDEYEVVRPPLDGSLPPETSSSTA